MSKRIVRPDLNGNIDHEEALPRDRRLRRVVLLANWAAAFGTVLGAIVILSQVIPAYGPGTERLLLLVKGLCFCLCHVLGFLRVVRRWSWLGYGASLAAYAWTLDACYRAYGHENGVMDVIPGLEIIMLAGLTVLHMLWSLFDRPAGDKAS